jgi:transcriptional regulator with XRE-family HTH domain
MSYGRIDFGDLISQLRISKGYSQKIVADKLGIDISLLSKIEHGERQIQGHMLKGISELFDIDYKQLQIQFLYQKIESEYGHEPFFIESLKSIIK